MEVSPHKIRSITGYRNKKNLCIKCGRYKYIPDYPWYLLEGSLDNRSIYVSWRLSGLIVTEELMERIDRKKFKGIEIFQVPILPEPVQGDEFDIPLTI